MKNNKRLLSLSFAVLLLFSAIAIPSGVKVFAVESVKDDPIAKETGVAVSLKSEEEALHIEELLQSEEDIQYYARLDLKVAKGSLKPVILEARNRIIFRYSWVADGVGGRISDKDGSIIEELPQFSELFPPDWDEPVLPVVVDLSYYAPPDER